MSTDMQIVNARATLKAMHIRSGCFYIVKIHSSRTNYRRHYVALCSEEDCGEIENITSLVCRATANTFDPIYGSINLSGSYATEDAPKIASQLEAALKMICNVRAI